ncbi:hypothetical protein ABZ543_08475 [Streptomyces roseifaciens]
MALVGGTLVGICITAAVSDRLPDEPAGDGVLLPLLIHLIPSIASTVISVKIFRRWLDESRTATEAATEARRVFFQEMVNRQEEIARREEALILSAHTYETRIAQAVQDLVDERLGHARLKDEFEELAADYNRVVCESLQQSADRFRPRSPVLLDKHAPCLPLPARPGHADAAHQQVRGVGPSRG